MQTITQFTKTEIEQIITDLTEEARYLLRLEQAATDAESIFDRAADLAATYAKDEFQTATGRQINAEAEQVLRNRTRVARVAKIDRH